MTTHDQEPIAGKPICIVCEKPLREIVKTDWPGHSPEPISRTKTGTYGLQGDGDFCTQRCAVDYALNVRRNAKKQKQFVSELSRTKERAE